MSWQKQTKDNPLYPDIIWSRPENKQTAGKLLVVGGNIHGIGATANSYSNAEKAGIGSCSVVLPAALEKTIGKIFPEAIFAPSSPSGSFSRESLATILDAGEWADAVLLAGDFGKNSETAIVIESIVDKYNGLLVVAGDAVDVFINDSSKIIDRPKTVISANFSRLQKLVADKQLLKHSMELVHVVEALGSVSAKYPCIFITLFSDKIICANNGNVSTTPTNKELDVLTTYAAVYALQNPSKTFESITTSFLN